MDKTFARRWKNVDRETFKTFNICYVNEINRGYITINITYEINVVCCRAYLIQPYWLVTVQHVTVLVTVQHVTVLVTELLTNN